MNKKFKDLVFISDTMWGGKNSRMFFPNGYGVSVIKHPGSYGYPKRWELAVLKGNKDSFDLCYDTPVTADVVGHLTGKDVTKYMQAIQDL